MKEDRFEMRTIIYVLFLSGSINIFYGCADRNHSERSQSQQSKNSEKDDIESDDQVLTKETSEALTQKNNSHLSGDFEETMTHQKIDASTLKTYKVTVSSQRDKLNLLLNLSYTPDGRADYVDYMICPLEKTEKNCPEGGNCSAGGECFEGITVYNRVLIPLLYGGNVSYKVRSCVDSENSVNEKNCGEWESIQYSSRLYNPEIAGLQHEAERIVKDLGQLVGRDYRDALIRFTEEANKCDEINADVKKVLDSKVRIIQQFLRAPISWFVKSGENVGDSVLGKGNTEAVLLGGLGILGEQISRTMETACVAFGKSTHDFVCSFLKGIAGFGKQMLGAMSPITGIGTLTNSIHDVYYGTILGQGDKLVAKACYAEQNLQKTVEAIEMQMQTKIQKLETIKTMLDQKGETFIYE